MLGLDEHQTPSVVESVVLAAAVDLQALAEFLPSSLALFPGAFTF